MSTADGLVVSSSQIFANDIYRRSIVPRLNAAPTDATIDRVSLLISRVASVLIVAVSIWLAWESQTMNVALLIAAGIGGMVAAIAGPIFTGILWRGTTTAGALSGFAAGGVSFIVIKSGLLKVIWFEGGMFEVAGTWLALQAPNPFACGTLGAITSVVVTVVVSWCTHAPDEAHLTRVFGESAA